MDKAKTAKPEPLPSQKVHQAVRAGDFDLALALTIGMPEEYIAESDQGRKIVIALLTTSEQLFRKEQMAISQRIKEAVQSGDLKRALALIDEKREQLYRPMHDALVDYKAGTYDQILRGFGQPTVHECHLALAEGHRDGFSKWEEGTVEDHLRTVTYLFASHMGKTQVSEDDEKYTVVLDPCGTGLFMARTGQVEPEGRRTRLPLATAGTWQRANVLTYCAHCAMWNEIGPIDWFGHPLWVFESWRNPHDVCRWYLYKDPNNIPEEHWTMFGKQKPSSLPKLKRGDPISKEEMEGLGLMPSQKLEAALKAGKLDKTGPLLDLLPKEYVLMVKGLGIVAKIICGYDEMLIRREQTAITEQVRSALRDRDAARVYALLERKEHQHRGMRETDMEFQSSVLGWARKLGDQAVNDLRATLRQP